MGRVQLHMIHMRIIIICIIVIYRLSRMWCMWDGTHTIAYVFKWIYSALLYLSVRIPLSLLFYYIYVLYRLFVLHVWSQPHSYYLTRVLTLHAIVALSNTCSGLFWQPRTCMFRYNSEEHGCGSGTSRRSSPSSSARDGIQSAQYVHLHPFGR